MVRFLRWRAVIGKTSLTLVLLLAGPASVWAQQATENNLVYQIFVRSFRDSDETSSPTARGDLLGIRDGLDSYLNDGRPETDHDLEVGILWLMPVFPADSYHGYNVRDYLAVSEHYGTMDDLRLLIQAAHARQVRIMLDLPLNHTSHNHPWFQQALAGDEAMRRRYHFRADDQPLTAGWHRAEHNGTTMQYFGLFDRSMPDLNFSNDEVKQEVKKIARFWLQAGIDGFRLDAAKHVFANHPGDPAESEILQDNDWWLEFSNYCYSVNPQAVLVGEVLGSREMFRRYSYGLEGLLDQPFMRDARRQMAFPNAGFVGRLKSATDQSRVVNRMAGHMPDRDFVPFLFLGSHDETPRLASYLEDQRRNGMQAAVDQAYRVGIYMLLTMGQTPVIYNGDELMQRGYKWDGSGDGSGIYDETIREPLPWYKAGDGSGQTRWFTPRFDKAQDGVSVEEQNSEGGMLHLVRGLTNFRTRHPALANGQLGQVLGDTHDWMVFERTLHDAHYLVLINPTGTGNNYQFRDDWFPEYAGSQLVFWSDGQLRTWADETNSNKQIDKRAFVPGYGLVILKQQPRR